MMKTIVKNVFLGFFVIAALLNVATIRRNEDPVLKTQTDPISLKQKLEETKDGVKGAPTPSFKYYDKEEFLSRSAVGTGDEEKTPNVKEDNKLEEVSEVGEVGLETPQLEVPKNPALEVEEDDDWWTEDQAQEQAPK